MVGVLVHGDNHFIVRGPLPNREAALALIRHWSFIQIGATTPPQLEAWRISSREFRENLEWGVIVPGDREISSAVAQLLDELTARELPFMTRASIPGENCLMSSSGKHLQTDHLLQPNR